MYREWTDKAAGIVSDAGWAAGIRAAKALRLVLAELHEATVRAQPVVPLISTFASGIFVPDNGLAASFNEMLKQLMAWSPCNAQCARGKGELVCAGVRMT